MTPDLISLLVQIPIVGAFIWYSLEMNKRSNEATKSYMTSIQELQERFMNALDKRDEAFERRNVAIVNTLMEHDKKTDVAIATMYERTKEEDAAKGKRKPLS